MRLRMDSLEEEESTRNASSSGKVCFMAVLEPACPSLGRVISLNEKIY